MLSTPARSVWRPQLTQLEDRTTPVTISGNTVTLDDVGELLTISTATAGTYTLQSSTDGTQSFTPAAGTVTVVDSATGTGVTYANSTATYANPFAVTLDDAPGVVTFTGLVSFGANSLAVTTTRNILVNGGASLRTTSGDITLSANQQATPTAGDFVGVEVRSGNVKSDTGTVRVSGRGGTAAAGKQIGVWVLVAAEGISSSQGAVFVTGTGGASTGNSNYGVEAASGRIRTDSGQVTVVGTGGGVPGTIPLTVSNFNIGVFVSGSGMIAAFDGGTVNVTGTGGAGGLGANAGVHVNGEFAVISSFNGGSVTVNGTGGGPALNAAFENHGVLVSAGGEISTQGTGAGAVNVTGRGNTSGLSAGPLGNVGVFVSGGFSAITSGGGPITVQGTDGTYLAVVVQIGGVIGTINASVSAAVTVTTDTLDVNAGTISAGGGTLTLQPLNANAVVALGGADDARHTPPATGGPGTLGLTAAELDYVIAGTLVIGRPDTQRIDLLAPLLNTNGAAIRLVAAGDLRATADGVFRVKSGGPLTLAIGGNVVPLHPGVDFYASSVTATAGAGLELPFLSSGPAQLRVDGSIDLTGMRLVLSGSTVPTAGQSFTLVESTGARTGFFSGLPDGATTSFNGVDLQLTYTPTAVTATVVGTSPPSPPVPPVPPLPPLPVGVVIAVGDTVRSTNPADGSTRTFVPFPGSRVSVASADLNGDGVPDVIIGAGPGGGPHVRAFDGATGGELASFFAYSPAFRGGVNVSAAGGRVVVGAGAGGGPHVKVIDASRLTQTQPNGEIANSALLGSFFAFDLSFAGGVSVAVGDVSADGTPDVVVGAGAGGGPHVKVIDGTRFGQVQASGVIADSALLASFFAFDLSFTGGVNVGATGGRFAVGAGAGGEPQVKLYRVPGGLVEERNDRAFDAGFGGGVRVGFADVDADGDIDLLTAAGPGGGPHLKAFNIAPFALVRSQFVGDPTDTRGVDV